MRCSLVFVFFLAFGFCAAQNYTLPECAQVCAGTAATAAGCYSFSNSTCVCASQPFQAAIQSCFNTSCNITTQGTAWLYYSNLCTGGSSAGSGASTFSDQSTTTTSVSVATSTAPGPVTSNTSSSTHTSSLSSVGSASVSSTTTSAHQTPTSTSGALATEIKMLHGLIAVVVGCALIL